MDGIRIDAPRPPAHILAAIERDRARVEERMRRHTEREIEERARARAVTCPGCGIGGFDGTASPATTQGRRYASNTAAASPRRQTPARPAAAIAAATRPTAAQPCGWLPDGDDHPRNPLQYSTSRAHRVHDAHAKGIVRHSIPLRPCLRRWEGHFLGG
jgi:hypothetical protein